jgi:acid phosphatase (class A)
VGHADLRPCVPLEDSWSFPSGHATWYAAAAQLLADLLPERRERLLEVGRQGGFARVSCGVHYPSDVLASQRLGEAISRDVIASPQWRRFREQSRASLQTLLTPPPAGLPVLVD